MTFRVTLELEGETYKVLAKKIDMHFHPYMMLVEELEFEDQIGIIVSAAGDKSRKRFGEVSKIYVPMQTLRLVEEIAGKDKIAQLKVITPTIVPASDTTPLSRTHHPQE